MGELRTRLGDFVTGALVTFLAVGVSGILLHLRGTARLARSQVFIGRLAEKIEIGDARDDVMSAIVNTNDGVLRVDEGGRSISAAGPTGFFAQGWILLVELDGNVVSAVRIRTADGPKPPGTIPDRVQ